MRLYDLSVKQVSEGIRAKDFSAEEYISQILERINKVNGEVNAFVLIDSQGAIEKARLVDKKVREDGKKVGALAGTAIGIKDNICTKGLKTTCASKILEEYVPPYDATVVRRLKDDDAIIIGKLNLDEFAMGSSTEFSNFGPTHNPWNIDCVAGGSSGGSAASVASSECPVSLGSDTGGSIRCPASFCSVVGLKPTYGQVSRFGLVPYANSLEQIGPIGKTVSDVVMIMNTIAGADYNDQTVRVKYNTADFLSPSKRKLRIGLIKELTEGAEPDICKCIYSAMDLFSSLDCYCEEVSINYTEYALASYYTIAMAEASSNLARYDNIRYGFNLPPDGYEWNSYFAKVRSNFGDEVKRRIIIGTYILSSAYYGKYYLKAQRVRTMLKREVGLLFKKYDALITPTMPVLPFKLGEKIDDPVKMFMIDIDTVLSNLAGIPSISVPAGFSNGLPIGLQIMADEFQEQRLFDAALMFENETNIDRCPEL
ncbi:MAG: Asp-tRNA(Asn)/Glu-tRNA(Gln) amidotransferase subunit GatA [Thermoproteota archaeon]|nr:Asp-tRNA(Asn)/Glu-tRNA(Gln) amidotransferase subunit GatA [Thermoproteota archaeon]